MNGTVGHFHCMDLGLGLGLFMTFYIKSIIIKCFQFGFDFLNAIFLILSSNYAEVFALKKQNFILLSIGIIFISKTDE